VARRSGSALERLVRPRPQNCPRTWICNLRDGYCGQSRPENLEGSRIRAAAPLGSDALRCLLRRPDGLTEERWLGRRGVLRCATAAPSLVGGELVSRRIDELLLPSSRLFTREHRWLSSLVAVLLTPKALTLLACHLICPARPNVLARAAKMYRVPQAGPRRPAVAGPVVQRGVRPRSCFSASSSDCLRTSALPWHERFTRATVIDANTFTPSKLPEIQPCPR